MRFLADENFPGDAVEILRKAGHDVVWVRTDAPGSPDTDVLARGVQERRIILTFDKDFGELAWRHGLPSDCGIVLFRLRMPPGSRSGDEIAAILEGRNDWSANFSVIEADRVRMRPLPPAP